jgi:hypothetical protein
VVTPAALVEEVRSYPPERYERAFEQLDAPVGAPSPVLSNPVTEAVGEVWEDARQGAASVREGAGNVVENGVEWVVEQGGRLRDAAGNLWDRRPWKR